MQISYKVALSISLVVAFAGAVAIGVALDRQEAEQQADFKQTNEQALELLAVAFAPAMDQGRHDRVQAVIDNIANFKEERFAQVEDLEVVNLERRVVAAYDPTRFNEAIAASDIAEDLKLAKTSSRYQDDHLAVVVPLRLKHPLGVFRAKLNRRHLIARIEKQKRGAIALLVATMLLIGLLLTLIHRHFVGGRLSELAKVADRVEGGDMDVRAAVEGRDEIATLGESFNSMAKAIKLYTEDLEQIIDERTEELRTANARLETMATTDQLTGVWNRRYFEDAAPRALEVARRNERPLCVALVDTDRFKSVNDTFGHPVGDEVLEVVADVLKTNARKADLVARIGGEEFAILMPEAGVGLAAQAAERMRAALERDVNPRVPALGGRTVTASFGVAAFVHTGDTLKALLKAADLAMYQSKSEGRNQVTIANRGEAPDNEPE